MFGMFMIGICGYVAGIASILLTAWWWHSSQKVPVMGSNDIKGKAWVLYKDRGEWKDITPIPQNDGPKPVVEIPYTEAFTDIYDYFRAILTKGELSGRALELTSNALHLNAQNSTVWQYRRKIIKYLGSDLARELDFCSQIIKSYPKCYQVWHHRRVIVEWLDDPSKESMLTKIIFREDAKNHHAWEHRQWVLRTFKHLLEGELSYVDSLIEKDVRNNSAWNQRYFTITQTTGFTSEVIEQEVEYAQKAIEKVIDNESPWSYLRGILQHYDKNISSYGDLNTWCEEKYNQGQRCPYLLAFMIHLKEDKMEQEDANKEKILKNALELCEVLATEKDSIRREYWRYMSRRLSQRFGS